MSNKSDILYFNNFKESADISYEAAVMLKNVLTKFSVDTLPVSKAKISKIEQRGNEKRSEIKQMLVHAFITPIERNDILKLSQYIDDVTDSIEDIFIQIYINNITHIRPDSIKFTDIVIKCCLAVKEMFNEFHNYKKSKKLVELIAETNRLVKSGNEMYIEHMRILHTTSKDPIEIIEWSEIYNLFKKSCNSCKNVADLIESITIRNI